MEASREGAPSLAEIYQDVMAHANQVTVAVGNLDAQLRRLAIEVENAVKKNDVP